MRLLLRLISPLLGLVVAAIGVVITLEAATLWIAPGSSPLIVPWRTWRDAAQGLTWSDGTVRTVAILVGVVGLLAILVGLFARRHDVLLSEPVPEVTVTTTPHSLARAVGHEVRSLSDVVSASVVASRRKVVVRAGTLDAPDQVRTEVRDTVEHLLARLPLARRPRVSVSVTATKGVK